jgi:hypothetical protein
MDLRPLYPRATAPAVLALPRVACGGLARTLLLHGLGAHPASRLALRQALRRTGQVARCTYCLGQHPLNTCVASRPAAPPCAPRPETAVAASA